MRRVVKFILIAAAVLVLLAAGVIQLVLWSDVPRSYVVAGLEKDLGLDVTVGEVRTGWRGHTHLTDLTLTLPLDDQPIFEAPEFRVKHTSLLPLLVGRPLIIEAIEASQGQIRLARDEDGTWNVQRLLTLLESGKDTGDDAERADGSPVPEVKLTGLMVEVRDHEGDPVSLGPMLVEVVPDGAHAARLRVEAGDLLTLEGRTALSGDMRHELRFELQDMQKVAAIVDVEQLGLLKAQGQWRGRIVNDVVVGMLNLQDASLGDINLRGEMEASIGGDSLLVVMPRQLTIEAPAWLPEAVMVEGGRVELSEALRLRLAGVTGRSSGAAFRVDGDVDLIHRSGEAVVAWSDLAWPENITQRGRVAVEFAPAEPAGQYVLQGQMETAGRSPWGAWDATFDVNAQGSDTTDLTWRVSQLDAALTDESHKVDIAHGLVRGRVNWPTVVITQVDLPVDLGELGSGQITGEAQAQVDTRRWAADVELQKAVVPMLEGRRLRARIKAEGSPTSIALTQGDIQLDDVNLQAQGQVSLGDQGSAQAQFKITGPAGSLRMGDDRDVAWADWQAHGQISGLLSQDCVAYTIDFLTRQVAIDDTELPHLRVVARGHVDRQRITMMTEPVEVLGATVVINAAHEFAAGAASAKVGVESLNLARMDDLVDRPPKLSGIASGSGEVSMRGFDPATLKSQGAWRLDDFSREPLTVEKMTGRFDYDAGRLTLTRIDGVQSSLDGGTVTGDVSVDLEVPGLVETDLVFRDWRFPMPHVDEGHVVVSGVTDVSVDVANLDAPSAFGQVAMELRFMHQGRQVGDLTFDGKLDDDLLEVEAFDGHLLGGQIQGGGAISWRRHGSDRITLRAQQIDISQLNPFLPEAVALQGRYSGSLVIAPTKDKRAPAPFEARLQLQGGEVRVNGLEVGDIAIGLFFDQGRFALDETRLEIAGGSMQIWGRLTQRDDGWHAYVRTKGDEMDLTQLTALAPEVLAGADRRPPRGIISGDLRAFGPINDRRRASGNGSFKLANADLAEIPMVDGLYNLLNLRHDDDEPSGTGAAAVRLEGTQLVITNVQYENRGTKMNLVLRVEDLAEGKRSPIEGFAVAVINPLPSLPFVQDFVDALTAYQGDVTSARISGTLDKQEVTRVPLRIWRDLGLTEMGRGE